MFAIPDQKKDYGGGVIEKFLIENPDLRFKSPSGVNIELIESFGFVELMIRVDPNTTINSLRDSGSWIIEWRDRVHTWNRTRLGLGDNGENRLFAHLDSLNKDKYSYGEIAELVNSELVEWIESAMLARQNMELSPGPSPEMDFETWKNEQWKFRFSELTAISNFHLLLRTLGFDNKEIGHWKDTLSKEVKLQKSKIQIKDEPVSREKIRNWLEHRRKRSNVGGV